MAPKYPKFELRGDMLRRWMESTDEPQCPIRKSTLKLVDMQRSGLWFIQYYSQFLPEPWHGWAAGVGLPIDEPNGVQGPIYRSHSILKISKAQASMTRWIGRTGPGVIFIDIFKREKGSADPYMSEFAKGFYEMNFNIESLKYVVFTTVIEDNTRPFINNDIYSSRGLLAPLEESQTWESPSAEFCGILGTPIGKVAGAIVLGAFGQGIKRILRVVTFHAGYSLHIQFEIEDV